MVTVIPSKFYKNLIFTNLWSQIQNILKSTCRFFSLSLESNFLWHVKVSHFKKSISVINKMLRFNFLLWPFVNHNIWKTLESFRYCVNFLMIKFLFSMEKRFQSFNFSNFSEPQCNLVHPRLQNSITMHWKYLWFDTSRKMDQLRTQCWMIFILDLKKGENFAIISHTSLNGKDQDIRPDWIGLAIY